jgi:iron(III) transport system ATP-binding protein
VANLEIRALRKAYGSSTAVDRIDLAIEHGQLVCLLGPSGCGKTTTLRLVAGFAEPDGGEIVVGTRRLSAPGHVVPPERRNMSMIFQSYAIWPHMTVYDNVAYGLKLRRLSRSDIAQRVRAILEVVRLEALAERYPGELSGGQQQRVALARALVVEPETLLLDEPLSNLDAHLREEMRFEIRRLHEQYKITTVYVTHDQSEAMVIADRVAVMNRGLIEQLGTPEEIYERPRTEFVARFIGQTNLVSGMLQEDQTVQFAGGTLRIDSSSGSAPGKTVTVSIRPHDIELTPSSANGSNHTDNANRLPGRVVRAYYLGALRDYQVEVGTGIMLRVLAPTHVRIGPGEGVTLRLPVEKCRLLVN